MCIYAAFSLTNLSVDTMIMKTRSYKWLRSPQSKSGCCYNGGSGFCCRLGYIHPTGRKKGHILGAAALKVSQINQIIDSYITQTEFTHLF